MFIEDGSLQYIEADAHVYRNVQVHIDGDDSSRGEGKTTLRSLCMRRAGRCCFNCICGAIHAEKQEFCSFAPQKKPADKESSDAAVRKLLIL